MKKWIVLVGLVLTLLGLFQGGKYLMDYSTLTNYGKGYVWGSIILIALGSFLIFIGLKKKKS